MLTITYLGVISVVLAQKSTNMRPDRNTIVHLFEWKFSDISNECERFLQHKGYGGVQVSPVSENVIITNRPWWERYQPISYKIITRSGDEKAFLDMTRRCNAVGIRIYVDVVFNHMTGHVTNAIGTGGSTANTDTKEYPEVPYSWNDFHQGCLVTNYSNAENVRNCEFLGLHDLNQNLEHVRHEIVQFMNKLISFGVAGFRVDGAKHMSPNDLAVIYNKLNNLNVTFGFDVGSKPYIYQEVIDLGGEAISASEYVELGAVTEFKYSVKIGSVFRKWDKLTYLNNWGAGWGFLSNGTDALVFVDNHDNQRGNPEGGKSILTYTSSKEYKMATAFMLAHPYGSTRIMSSFDFNDTNAGPPADAKGEIVSPGINTDDTCSNGWICEHRWRQIYNMIGFRNAVRGTAINDWWSNGNQQIAFCRGDKGFVAFTNGGKIDRKIQTCLKPGTYCDVISGNLIDGSCTGKRITVRNFGFARIELGDSEYDGVLAIHINSRLA